MADQEDALKFAGVVDPGFDVFPGKKVEFKTVSCSTASRQTAKHGAYQL
ncbi:MAG: hypothetical protein ABSE15_04290 [Candidatus Bathyarchaeia archaeon]|jgi:hypothetical protein